MFSDYDTNVCTFSSNWKKTYVTKEFETQTDTYKIVHRGLNVKRIQSKECQTDSYLFVEEDIHADIDELDLVDFINKVFPNIIKALENNERSTAFISYKTVMEEESSNICIHTINKKRELTDVMNISQISWNCTGSVLAASFGEINHNKWCAHTNTGVGIFGLSSRNKSQLEEKSSLILETTTCACCVQFHHSLPSVVAAGTHNGELIIWDRSRPENETLLTSSVDNKVHEDSINSVFWLKDFANKSLSSNYRLITLSMDGTIVLWNLSTRKNNLTSLNCYRLTGHDLPKSVRYKGNMTKNLCIISGSLNPFDNEYLVTGTNSGSIFICRIRSTEDSSAISNANTTKSPVDSILTSLDGAVHSISWSNTIRNLVVVVSVDGLIHIYNSEQREQILTVDPGQGYLYDLSLSPLLHGVVATAGENGTIVLSDILSQNIVQDNDSTNLESTPDIVSGKIILKIQDSGNNQPQLAMNCVAFNDKNFQQLAASDMNGTIYVWQLGQQNIDKGTKSRQMQLEEVLASVTK